MRALFVTGGTGFIGRDLLRSLNPAEYRSVTCLSRAEPVPSERATAIRYIRGDIREPESYTRHLAGSDTVLHLAAATGRQPRDASRAVNAEGTRRLVHECQRHGVRDFLLASTIAVKYPNARQYPYAETKQLAEAALRESGLRYVIVRPTIVIGPHAPIWRSLADLAKRRVIVMPGRGRVRIQPIFVDDLVASILALVNKDRFHRGVFELGGPEVTSFEAFLRMIHRLRTGREPAVIHLPVRPLMTVLARLEPLLRNLPVTAGQLSAFRYDSTADPELVFQDSIRAVGIEAMIQKSLADG